MKVWQGILALFMLGTLVAAGEHLIRTGMDKQDDEHELLLQNPREAYKDNPNKHHIFVRPGLIVHCVNGFAVATTGSMDGHITQLYSGDAKPMKCEVK
jgi:hypothetical protein